MQREHDVGVLLARGLRNRVRSRDRGARFAGHRAPQAHRNFVLLVERLPSDLSTVISVRCGDTLRVGRYSLAFAHADAKSDGSRPTEWNHPTS